MGKKIRIPGGVIHKTVGDEIVLLDLDRGVYYGLDQVGARVWELVEADHTLPDIIDILLEEYEVTRAELERDVTTLLEQLTARGLIERGVTP
jgi:hypothetical protein